MLTPMFLYVFDENEPRIDYVYVEENGNIRQKCNDPTEVGFPLKSFRNAMLEYYYMPLSMAFDVFMLRLLKVMRK